MNYSRIIHVFILASALSACNLLKKDKSENGFEYNDEYDYAEIEDIDSNYEVLSRESKITNYKAAKTVFTDLIHTKLEVKFDWSKSWMYGKETLTGKPHFYASDSLFLDAKGMQINSIYAGDQKLNFKYDGNKLRIQLDKVYKRDEKFQVVIDYIAKPDERKTSGSEAITSDKGLYFINPRGEDPTKMPQIWTQGETEASSVWFPTIDSPNAKTTQEILIRVDNKYVTLSNGKLVSSTNNADGTRTDHWKQDLPHAPYLFMMGIGEFKIVKDSYTKADGTKMEVNYYVEPAWEKYARNIFGETPKMIAFFSKITGVEYPWDKYNQIVVREYVSGAMENTGAVIFGDYAYKTDRDLLDSDDNSTIAHELFHHWFGDLVTAESWSNLTLNESFANYSQYLWDEHRYGLDQADYNAEKEAEGYVSSANQNGFHDLVWFYYESQEQMFDGHSYNKGGRILHMLRNYLGDEAFFLGIKNYLTANQFKAAEFHQLRLAFEEVSGEDLNWFFNQWYLGSNHPTLNIDQYFSVANQEVVLTVTQTQFEDVQLFKLPVEIAVYDDAGVHVHKVIIDKAEKKFVFPVKGKLKTVIFDHQQMLLADVVNNKPQEEFIAQYYVSNRFKARKDALLLGTFDPSPAAEKLIFDALKDQFWNLRVIAIEQADLLKDDYKTRGIELIKSMALSDSSSAVRSSAITFLSNHLAATEFETLMLEIISKDQSYTVLGNALTSLSTSNVRLAMVEAKKLEQEKSSKMKSGIAQLYASQGGETELQFFEDLFKSNILTGVDAIYGLNSLTIYMSRQKPEIQAKTVDLYRIQQKNGGVYATMFMPQNVEYMVNSTTNQITKLEAEIEGFEKTKDMVYADRLRKELNKYKSILKDLQVFQAEIAKTESNTH